MLRSETVKEIAPAFLEAQASMQAAAKDATNPHFGSRYSDFASVAGAVKGPLNGNGIAFLQPVRLVESGVEIETILMHKSGEFLSETLVIPLARKDAQSIGSAISYGRRYGLQSICGLPSEDDDGNAANDASGNGQAAGQRKPMPPKPPAKQTPAPTGVQQDAEAMEKALLERGNTDPMDDAAKFEAILHEAFDAAEFHASDRGAVIARACKQEKVTRITDLGTPRRSALLKAIVDGKFDSLKKHAPATAGK